MELKISAKLSLGNTDLLQVIWYALLDFDDNNRVAYLWALGPTFVGSELIKADAGLIAAERPDDAGERGTNIYPRLAACSGASWPDAAQAGR